MNYCLFLLSEPVLKLRMVGSLVLSPRHQPEGWSLRNVLSESIQRKQVPSLWFMVRIMKVCRYSVSLSVSFLEGFSTICDLISEIMYFFLVAASVLSQSGLKLSTVFFLQQWLALYYVLPIGAMPIYS